MPDRPGLTVSFPFTDEQAQAVVVAADAFGVEPWEMASHLVQLRWQLVGGSENG